MKIKLIASDLDDTLLNNERKISARNEAAIRQAIAAGVVFTLASGRMYCSMKPYAEKLGLDVPLVSYNGGLVKGALSGNEFVKKPLKLPTALKLLQYAKQKGYYIQVYINDQLFIKEHNAYSAAYCQVAGIQPIAIGEDVYNITTAPNKLLLMTEAAEFAATWQDIAERFKDEVDVTSSKDNYLELMEPGVNKWVAIKELAAGLGIKPEEIMCIGDSNNDLCMIKNAGIGVAVGNAKDEVQHQAKIVTAANDHDGVALVIESILANND